MKLLKIVDYIIGFIEFSHNQRGTVDTNHDKPLINQYKNPARRISAKIEKNNVYEWMVRL